MSVRARYFTDPASSASWAAEPMLRRMLVEFGKDLSITYVMGGLAREFPAAPAPLVREWHEAPLHSSYPACMAVKAAAEQGPEAEERCLRALREGI